MQYSEITQLLLRAHIFALNVIILHWIMFSFIKIMLPMGVDLKLKMVHKLQYKIPSS